MDLSNPGYDNQSIYPIGVIARGGSANGSGSVAPDAADGYPSRYDGGGGVGGGGRGYGQPPPPAQPQSQPPFIRRPQTASAATAALAERYGYSDRLPNSGNTLSIGPSNIASSSGE